MRRYNIHEAVKYQCHLQLGGGSIKFSHIVMVHLMNETLTDGNEGSKPEGERFVGDL